MQTQNSANGGLNTDIDEYLMQPTTLRDALNVRIISRGDNAYVIQNVEGTSKAFELTPGFKPLGGISHNGLVFVISYAETTNEIEVGSYPSPDYALLTGVPIENTSISAIYPFVPANYPRHYTGYVDLPDVLPLVQKYAPLHNLRLGVNLVEYRSTLLRHDLRNAIVNELCAKDSYDQTTTLYWTDGATPLRALNTALYNIGNGSVKLGEVRYDSVYAYEQSLLVPTTRFNTDVSCVNQPNEGALLPGAYVYHVIYVADTQARTNIIASTGSIVVYNDGTNVVYGADGSSLLGQTVDISDLRTTKAIDLRLTDVDTSYKYVRLVVEYATGLQTAVTTYYEIDKNYGITGSTLDLRISGNERSLDRSADSVSNAFYGTFVCKSIDEADSRLLCANVSTPQVDYDKLNRIAKCIKLGYAETDLNTQHLAYIDETQLDVPITETSGGHLHWRNLQSKVGYWGGESYAVGVVFKLAGGDESDVYFPTGVDYATPGQPTNDAGIIRFPYRSQLANKFERTVSGVRRFNNLAMTASVDLVPLDSETLDYAQTIIGYKLVRQERVKDCVTQGIVVPTYSTYNAFYSDSVSWLDFCSEWSGYENRASPGYAAYSISDKRRVVPSPMGLIETQAVNTVAGTYRINGIWPFVNALRDENRYAFYSMDAILDTKVSNALNDVIVGLYPQTYVNLRLEGTTHNPVPVLPSGVHYDYMPTVLYSRQDTSVLPAPELARAFEVLDSRDVTNGKFSSAIKGLIYDGGFQRPTNYQHRYNAYIGFKTEKRYDQVGGLLFNTEVPARDDTQAQDTLSSTLDGAGLEAIVKTYTTRKDAVVTNVYNNAPKTTPLDVYPSYFNGAYHRMQNFVPLSGTQTVFGGDCYITVNWYRMTFNPNDRVGMDALELDNPVGTPVLGGTLLQWVSESSICPIRSRQLVDINERTPYEDNKRSFYPMYRRDLTGSATTIAGLDVGTWTSALNVKQFYNAKLLNNAESRGADKGYEQSSTRTYVGLDPTLPYTLDRFPTRVVYSDKQVGLSITDAYRTFRLVAAQDYDISKGEAVSIRSLNGNVYLIQQRGIAILPYREKAPISQGTRIYFEGAGVLGDIAQYVSNLGSLHTHSICKTLDSLYGVDCRNKALWRCAGQVKDISAYVVSSYLYAHETRSNEGSYTGQIVDRLKRYAGPDEYGRLQIRTTHDLRNNEVLFTFYDSTSAGSHETDNSFTLAYNEMANMFTSFFSFSPLLAISAGTTLYSWNARNVDETCWVHNDPTAELNTFYGAFYESYIDFVINEGGGVSKVFDVHKLDSNNVYPSKFVWDTENQRSTADREFLLRRHKMRQEENIVYVTPTRSTVDKHEAYNHSRVNSRIRDKYVRMRIYYDVKTKLRLRSVVTEFRQSRV
jgi:hypothetical protein